MSDATHMIERLYIHNFRCFENFSIEFSGRPSVLLIGKNGSGKSTLLRALELFQSICRGATRVGNLISASDFTRGRTDEPMRFEVEFALDGRRFKYVVALEWPAGFREARILDESLQVNGASAFSRRHSQVQLSDGAAFGLDWHVFALPVINERPPERSIQDVKSFLASMVLIAPAPALISGFAQEPSNELRYDAANFAACLLSLLQQKPKAYSAFESYLRQVFPDFSSIENAPRGENGTQLIVRFESPQPPLGLSVEFKALSDGEKCFFLSAYIIASSTVASPVVCFWDEPDSHLSIPEVGQFITGLRKMASRGGQFVATTHDSEAVRRFSDENTFVLMRQSHLEPTVARPLSALPYTGDLVEALERDEILS